MLKRRQTHRNKQLEAALLYSSLRLLRQRRRVTLRIYSKKQNIHYPCVTVFVFFMCLLPGLKCFFCSWFISSRGVGSSVA